LWQCRYEGDRIGVYLGRKRGDYILLKEPYCLKCACPGVTTEECPWHWDDYGFERVYAMGAYLKREIIEERGEEDFLSSHILGLKQYPRYAVPLGLGLVACVKNRYSELARSDLIVPIPKFPTELKVATDPLGLKYNQSVELSKVISSNLNITSIDILKKTREQSMRGLGEAERREVVKGLYEVGDRAAVRDKHIILIDDVSTSGATASECAQVLMDAGAKMVNVLVAGRNTDTSV
jgi:predicted amidophosphoribosyltransferase